MSAQLHTELNDTAVEYGDLARRALEGAGGDTLVLQAEADPSQRASLVVPALAELGAWDLDPLGSDDELQAAAVLCRAAGYWAAPYPVAAQLALPTGVDANGLFVVAEHEALAPVVGLDGRWATVTLSGRVGVGTARPSSVAPRYSAFVTALDAPAGHGEPGAGDLSGSLALALVLPCWTLLGMLDRSLLVTREYVMARRQFGQTLSSFQSVQFQLTDAEVERVGLEELAKYALWSIGAGRPDALADALALRVAAIEAAEVVLRVSHQLHGAIGFCDETLVSWLSRHSLPFRRHPMGLSASREALVRTVGRFGLSGLFDELAR